MNPQKSLMAFFAVVSLILPGAARATGGEWAAITAGQQTFFLPRERFDGLQANKPEKLFTAKDPASASVATVTKKVKKKKVKGVVKEESSLEVNLLDGTRKKGYKVSAQKGEAAPADNQGSVTAPKRPDGVSEEIWNVVMANPDVKPDKDHATLREDVAKALAAHPEAFTKLAAAGQKDVSAAVSQVGKLYLAGRPGEVDAFLNNVGQQQAAAPQQPRVTTPNGVEPPAANNPTPALGPDGKPIESEKDVVGIIGDLLLAPSRGDFRQRVVDRFNEFIFDKNKTGDKAYVSDATLKQPEMDKRLKAAVAARVKDSLSLNPGPAHQRDIAVLYFVMGDNADLPGDLGKSVPKLQLLKDSPERDALDADKRPMLPRLEACMAYFTGAKTVCDIKIQTSQPAGPYAGAADAGDQAQLERWLLGFFADGEKWADGIYGHLDKSKLTIRQDIINHEDKPDVPGVGNKKPGVYPPGSDAERIMREGYNWKDLYVNGGVANCVGGTLNGDKCDGGRMISIKLYTSQEWVGGKPVLVDKLGVFDITDNGSDGNPGHIYGRRISLTPAGDSNVQLDDSRPDSLSYKISIAGNGTIQVTNPDGSGLKTSINQLYTKRAEQINDMPQVELNGQRLKAGFEGAPKGHFTYYAVDDKGNVVLDGSGKLTPTNIANLNSVGSSGYDEMMGGFQEVGNIGKNDKGDPQFYYMKWNGDTKKVEYYACDDAKKLDKSLDCQFHQPVDDTPDKSATKKPTDKKPTDKKPTDKKPTDGKPDDKPDESGGTTPTEPTQGGTTDKTDLPDKSCNLTESNFSGTLAKLDWFDDWKIFYQRPDSHNTNNSFYVCINGASNQTIFVGGVPSRENKGIWITDNDLQIEAVTPRTYIPPNDITNATQPKGSGKIMVDKTPDILNGRTLYLIAKEDTAAEVVKSLADKNGQTAYATRLSWVFFSIDPKGGDANKFTIPLRAANSTDFDAGAIVKTVNKAFTIGNAVNSPFANADDMKVIDDYITSEINSQKGKGIVVSNPAVEVTLAIKKTLTSVDPASGVDVIVNINMNGRDDGRTDDGTTDVRSNQGDPLAWCAYPKPGGAGPLGLMLYSQCMNHFKGK